MASDKKILFLIPQFEKFISYSKSGRRQTLSVNTRQINPVTPKHYDPLRILIQ